MFRIKCPFHLTVECTVDTVDLPTADVGWFDYDYKTTTPSTKQWCQRRLNLSSSLLLHGSNLFIIRHDHKQSKHIHCLRRCRFSGNLATCLYKHMGDTAAAAPSRRNYSACWVNASHPPTPPPTRYKYPKVTYSGLDGMGWDVAASWPGLTSSSKLYIQVNKLWCWWWSQ